MNTKTYIAMREMWARGLTVDEIADAVGMTRHAAFAMMRRDRAAFPRRRHHIDWWRRRLAEVERLPEIAAPLSEPKHEVHYRRIQELLETYLSLAPGVSPEIIMNVMSAEDLGELCDYIAQNLQLRYQVRQRILELADPVMRAEAMCEILEGENEVLSLTRKINQKVKQQMDRNQRDYYLREQMRAIEEELGEDDYYDEPDEDDGKSYISRIKKLGLPEESEEHLLKEAKRLSKTQPTSPENNVLSTYLDTVLELHETSRAFARALEAPDEDSGQICPAVDA